MVEDMSTRLLSSASLIALLAVAAFPACSEVTVVGSGGGGSGAGGKPAIGGDGQGNQAQGGDDNPPPPLPCEQRGEADCVGNCVALVDWSPIVPNAPPPPPDVVFEIEPCCPECALPQCIGCHVAEFKRCIPLDQCGVPQPPENCGVPLFCDQ